MDLFTRPLTTEALAHSLGLQSNSIRVRLCRTGSYFGLTPDKLPNGRLLWPADSKAQLLKAKTRKDFSSSRALRDSGDSARFEPSGKGLGLENRSPLPVKLSQPL